MPPGQILVVEDERSMGEFLEILLSRHGHRVTVAPSGKAGRDLLTRGEYDVVITDLNMPKVSGLEILEQAKKLQPHVEVIIITAYATVDTALAAMKLGAFDYLTKPFKVEEMVVAVERALERQGLLRDNQSLRDELRSRFQLDRMVGRSQAMQQLFALVRRVAAARTSVVILGESGTGKELVARAIHAIGDRADRPFVAVNCGAIPETLMESELFGYVKGAFTGATRDQQGLFAAAHDGTLFLDEISELGPSLQVKLLRALQERKVKPLGAVAETDVDVRVIAASNRDLEEQVAQQRFRPDLFYRLNVITLRVPPLREREDDIPLLAEHFLRKYAAEMGRSVRRITPGAMAALRAYHYPGNVRELENLIERAVTLATDDVLDTPLLPELRRPAPPGPAPPIPEAGLDLDQHMGELEREVLLKALERTGGSRVQAAELLKITLRSLRYRLSKYGIDPQE